VPLVLAVVLFAPATLGGKVISAGRVVLQQPPYPPPAQPLPPADVLQSDSGFVFEPDGLLVRRALRAGHLPIWTPAMSAGLPLLADQQSAPLFPLTWIGVVLPYDWSRAWINVLKLVLAALGTYLLARALALRRGPALLGGVAYGFAAYLVIWLLHPHANAYVVLPWLLLAADRLCERGTVRDAALLGLGLGISFLGGQPESGLIVSLATAAWVIHRLIGARPARGELARRLLLGVAAAVLGAALAAVMLLPLLEAIHQAINSSRSQPPLPARSINALFFPKYWGILGAGPANFAERTMYAGALPLLLAAAGLVARRPRGPQLFFAGLAVVSLAVALDTGPFSRTVHDLPVLDQAALGRVLILASFAIAMLAAFGLQLLLNGTAAERRRMLIAAGVVAVLPALVVVGAHPQWLGVLPDGVKRVFGAGAETVDAIALASVLRWLAFAAAAIAVFAALLRRRARTTLLIAAAIGLTALDLLTITAGYNPAISRAEASPPQPPAVAALRRATASGGRVVGVQAMQPNTASRWDLEDARGHEQPTVGRVALLWTALGGGAELNAPGVNLADPRSQKLLDVFGVRAVLLPPAVSRSSLPDTQVEYSGPGGVVVSNPSALPPAFVAYGWRASQGRTASALLMAAGTARQARDAPVIETASKPPAAVPGAVTPARVVSRTDTEVRLDVDAQADGHVVLLDTFYPGWHAEVDGREQPIRAADLAFRAVAVTPGRHTVRFFYRPTSVIAGGALSLAALLAIGVCLIGLRRRGGSDRAA
jgi:Bacterial membrane protein YfhO